MGRMSVGDGGLDGEGRSSSRVVALAERTCVYVRIHAYARCVERTANAVARDRRTHLRAREAKPLRARGRRGGEGGERGPVE